MEENKVTKLKPSGDSVWEDAEKCVQCKEIKPLRCFKRSRRRKTGYDTKCKACVRISKEETRK